MFETYIVNGRKYEIGIANRDRFLKMYPNAVLQSSVDQGDDLSILEGLKRTFGNNIGIQRQNTLRKIKLATADAISFFDYDAASWFLGTDLDEKGSVGYLDPNTGQSVFFNSDAYKRDGYDAVENSRYYELKNKKRKGNYAAGELPIQAIYSNTGETVEQVYSAEAQKVLDRNFENNKKLLKTTDPGITGFTDALKKGELDDMFVLGVDFLANTSIDAGLAAMTGGVSMAAQIYGAGYTVYNDEKSKLLYGADDPNRFQKLIQNGEDEVAIPAGLAAVGFLMERAGYRGIQKEIMKRSFGGKKAVSLLMTGGREGLTEYGQALTERMNKNLGQGMSLEEASIDVSKYMFTEEAFDQFFAGLIGGTGLSGGGSIVQGALRADQNSNIYINKTINEIAAFTEAKSKAKTKKEQSQIDDYIQIKQTELKEYLESNRKVSEYLNDKEIVSLTGFVNNRRNISNDIINLQKGFNKGAITENQFNTQVLSLKNKIKDIDLNIKKIKTDANMRLLKADLDKGGTFIGDVKGLQQIVYDTQKEFFEALEKEYTLRGKKMPKFKGVNINGLKIGNKLLINAQVAAEQNAVAVSTHEILHGIMKSTLQSNDGSGNLSNKGVSIVKNFISQLTSKEKSLIEKELLEGDYKFNKDGTEKDFKEYGEEYLNMYAELAKKDAFTKNNIQKAASWFSNLFNTESEFKKISFKDGKSTREFLDAYVRGDVKALEQAKVLARKGVKMKQTVEFSKKQISEKAAKISKTVNDIGKKATTKAEYDAGVNIEAYNYLIENKGLDGLILAELVKRGIDVKAEDANVNGQPLEFYIEDVRAKLIPDVLGFNPDKEVTSEGKFGLSGHINKRLKFRMGDVATKAKKTVTGRSLETPVGETGKTIAETVEDEGDARLKAFEEENLSISEQIRATETEQDKNELKSRYRHKLKNNDGSKLIDESRVESIREGIRSVLIKIADKVTSPDFLFNFENTVKADLKNIVQKAIGTKKQYRKFVLDNFEKIVDFTSVQDLVALERLVGKNKLKGGRKIFTVKVRRLTKIEDIEKAINEGKLPVEARNKTEQGVDLYEKRMPTKEELEAFFFGTNMQEVLGYKLGGSTLGTRKDGLARMIITELAQDGVMETIQEPAIAEEILSISQEADINIIVKNVATQVNRSPDLKFSKKLEETLKNSKQGTDIYRGATILVSGKGYYSKEWIEFMEDTKVSNKVKLELNIQYLQRDKENWYTVRKMEGMGARLKNIKGIRDKETGKIKKIPTYRKFEIIARDVAKGILEEQGYSVAHLTEKGKAPDIVINKKSNLKLEVGIEIKGTTARGVSRSFNYKKGRGFVMADINSKIYSENTKAKANKLLNKVNNRVKKMFSDLGVKPKYNEYDNLIITEQEYNKIKRSRLHLDKNFVDFIKTKDIEFMYLNKERPSQYMNLGTAGLFQLGNLNPLNIQDLNEFGKENVDIPITVRFDFSNKVKGGRRVSIRIEPQLDSRFFKEQDANLFKVNKPNIKIQKSITQDKNVSRQLFKASKKDMSKTKGASIFDFDETVGISENFVIATKGNIIERIPSEQWPLVGEILQKEGYEFDFTDFNKVTKGKPGPLLQKMKNQIEKYGPNNVFILTARAPESQKAIYDWLKSEGVNIPLKNITGLGNSTAEAKAMWVLNKYANEGYNDIYFVDDALQNVQAVKNMFDQLDIKGKSVQAKINFSKKMDKDFNKILEEVTGIEAKKRFMAIKARKRGEKKGKFRLFIPPSHEDFVGLLYNFMGKGKQGDGHREFFEKALVRPLNRAYREIDTAKQAIANDYKSLNKQLPDTKKLLKKKTPDGDFIYEDAIRIYLWSKHGYEIPGLSEIDQQNLIDLVYENKDLRTYAETLNVISKQDTYVKPENGWEAGNIQTDLIDATGRVGRDQYFKEFNENADILFSEDNLNKIEAAYGKGLRSAIEDMLHRIKTGVNRPKGQHAVVNSLMNYLNGSVGTVMFFNVRSAILQQMSIVNYINFADNNIFAAAKAFANQKQYWDDFAFIFNSDMLKQRRGGIGTDINGADLAQAVKGSKNPSKVVIGRLLKLGFLPTQIGDNIAIATGGATFYRNRINKYIKDGLSQKEAEAKAFTDFQDLTQSTQQSSRPDMTSQQQASWIGKLILNFQNITSQYNRIIKKAALDIKNKRISPPYTTRTQSNLGNLSKILYYGGIQNIIFYSLQSALFAVMFDDELDEDKILGKKERVISGSIDSILRGAGIYGAAASTLKNMVIKWFEQREPNYNKDESAVLMELLNFSPVVGIKSRMIVNAEKTINYNENVISEMETFDADNPAWSAATNYTQALTNFPANRLYQKSINMRNALDKDYTNFQRIMFFSGYTTWSLGLGDPESVIEAKEKIKINKKNTKKRKGTKKQRSFDARVEAFEKSL
jgi:hypothetical protein